MEVTVHTGANPGNAANAPSSYHLSFDLSEPAAHLGERMEDVYQVAFDYAMDGLTSVLIKLSQDKAVDAAAELANVGIGTAVVGVGGTLAAGVAEFNDIMSDTHNVPVTGWASYRDSISFIKASNDDGNSSTPLTYHYQTQGGVKIATTSSGLKFTGSSGDDDIYGSSKNNKMDGGNGDDWLRGGDGNDTINAGDGVDTLQGDSGDDILDGNGGGSAGGGADNLYGGIGEDTMYIYGNDTAEGGKRNISGYEYGEDSFVFRGYNGRANNVQLGGPGYLYDRLVVSEGTDVTAITLNSKGRLDTMTITDNDGDKNVVETDTFDESPSSVADTVNSVKEANALFHSAWADFV